MGRGNARMEQEKIKKYIRIIEDMESELYLLEWTLNRTPEEEIKFVKLLQEFRDIYGINYGQVVKPSDILRIVGAFLTWLEKN